MFAVIATGGKQYLIKSGDVLKIEKLPVAEGSQVIFDQVLMTANEDGTDVKIGDPYLKTKIEATLVKQGKTRTLLVEKYKRKVRYHKTHGQRQRYSQVKIAEKI
ncbi:MAG: 50S ribosomal protein L21 [Candidatus Magasanikbacteria bacterium CG10_big_fil_rev_8_21_14_0_10_36_32]|uniref:Large ribosomal subunit protein bL21 n=1 Tax=Candidatus Magasanikbacteria bacterium CG10_big_fil_rev_8_21_14_0_10_36_32 TaxID=1974646 RepID=A0A2M6W611_9BACT|nr:MAG: 50S ribosomal protein L21 [Candidatus Magasanikbacteria bacterium CG10_big_fil_rev_8_21_14_0_10_36_32]